MPALFQKKILNAHYHVVMTHTIQTFFKRLALASLIACSALANAQSLVGKVGGVIDGDTIDVLDDRKIVHRIRLAGIDAPEKAQPFGQIAKEHLSDIVFGKRVLVIGNKIDRYGRTVGKIEVGGIDANLEQVKTGLAWHYKEYAREQLAEDRNKYASAETNARVNRTGLWRDNKQIPP
jgi:endonuclease YncB( thermonuclease family)